jgi:hypothetical protein
MCWGVIQTASNLSGLIDASPRGCGTLEEHALEVHDHRIAGHVADQLSAAVAEHRREVELQPDAEFDDDVELQRVFVGVDRRDLEAGADRMDRQFTERDSRPG